MFGRKKHKKAEKVKNEIKPKEELNKEDEKSAEETKPKKKARLNLFRGITQFLDGSFLTRKYVIKLLPFFLFLSFLTILYIANSYTAQQKIKEIDKLNIELEELRNEHKSVKSELMYYKKMSEVAKRLESTGIKEPVEPPKKIVIDNIED